jgi:hypothetical protein
VRRQTLAQGDLLASGGPQPELVGPPHDQRYPAGTTIPWDESLQVSPRGSRSGRRRARPATVPGHGRGHVVHQVPAAMAVGPVQLPATPDRWGRA